MTTPRKTVAKSAPTMEAPAESFGLVLNGDGTPAQRTQEFGDSEFTPAPSAEDRVAAMLGEASDDARATVRLYRTKPPTGKQGVGVEFVDEMTPAEFESLGYNGLRAKWGGGEYMIRLYGVNPETGMFGIRAQERVTLAVPIDAPIGAHGASSEIGRMLQAMADNQAAMLRAITEKPAVDPMAQLAQMAQMFRMFKGLTGNESQQKSSIAEIVSAIKELREVSGEINGGDKEPADPMLAALPQLLEIVKAQVSKPAPAASAPVVGVRVPAALAAPRQAPAVAPRPLATSDPQGDLQARTDAAADNAGVELLALLDRVVKMGRAELDPADAAELLYERLPDDLLDQLLNKPRTWAAELVQMLRPLDPARAEAVASLQEWLYRVGDAVIEIYNQDGSADSEGSTEPGSGG